MRPCILVEPFAGMAALSFATMGCAPPISWMGSKRGYVRILMELLGLSRHNPPAAYIWGDVGPNVAALATLAGAGGDARDVAGWLACADLSAKKQPEAGYGAEYERFMSGARFAPPSMERVADGCSGPRASEVAAIIRGWKDEEPRALWTRLKAEGWPSLMPVEGGRWLGPQSLEEVAGWLFVAMRSWSNYEVGHVYKDYEKHADSGTRGEPAPPIPVLAGRVDATPAAPFPLACWQGTATRLMEQLPERIDNVVAYCDPPYANTTGYKFGDCPRSEVLRMALDLSRRGATVAISEAVRLDRELGAGWTAVQIDGERRGQKRTFSVQQHEWVTMNRPPVQVPGQQQGLFGGAR